MKLTFLPKRGLVILLSTIGIVQCNIEYQFLSSNSCGCFSDHPVCHEVCKLLPQPRNLVFDEFPSKDECSEISLEGYNISVTDEFNGNIRLTLLLNPMRPIEELDFQVVLKTLTGNSTEMLTHSVKEIRSYNASANIPSVLQTDFSHLYSGIYQLEFLYANCQTRNFSISSLYQQERLNKLEPHFHSKFISDSHVITTFSQGGLQLSEKLKIMFYAGDCESDSRRTLEAVVLDVRESNEPCCSHLKMSEVDEDTQEFSNEGAQCPCSWNGSKLKCIFKNVSEGLYCTEIYFIDRRCAHNTVWTVNGSCGWYYNINATGIGSPSVFKMSLSPRNVEHLYLLYSLLLLGIIAVFLVVIFLWIRSSKKFNEGAQNSGPIKRFFIQVTVKFCTILYISRPKLLENLINAREKYLSLNLNNCNNSLESCIVFNGSEKFSTPEILLLYPRDCEFFMRAMTEFRKNLEGANFMVHDPWDDDIYDNVVESYEAWTLPFIKNEHVRIIIVLNECSKIFEKAFLENASLEYREPQILDTIFRQSLSSIHHYFAKRFDSYQRLFVIRFEESSPENFILLHLLLCIQFL